MDFSPEAVLMSMSATVSSSLMTMPNLAKSPILSTSIPDASTPKIGSAATLAMLLTVVITFRARSVSLLSLTSYRYFLALPPYQTDLMHGHFIGMACLPLHSDDSFNAMHSL